MAIVEDASSPASVTAQASTVQTTVTASFTPPAGSLIIAVASNDWNTNYSGTPSITFSDSLGGTWTAINNANDGSNGAVMVGTAYRIVGASAAMTVTATSPDALTKTKLLSVRVLTGAATSGTIATSLFTGHASTTNFVQQTVTTTKAGSKVITVVADDNNELLTVNGNTTQYAQQQDSTVSSVVASGRSTNLTTTPGSLSIGWTGSSTLPQAVAIIEVMPDAGGLSTVSGYWPNTWAPTFDIPNTVLPTSVPFLLLGDRTYVPPPQDLGTLVGVQSGETPGSTVTATAGSRDFGTLVGIPSAEVEGAVTVTAGSVDFGTVVGISSTETYGSAVSVGTSEPGSTSGRWPNSWAPGLDLPVTPLPSLVPFQLLGDRGLIVIPPTDFGTVVGVPSTETPGPAISISLTTDLGTLVGVPSAERSGAVTVAAGSVDLGTLVGVPTAERTGAATTAATIDLGTVVGVPTAGVTGAAVVSATATVNPVGVPSAERVGAATLLSTVDFGTVAGISSSEIIGATITILAPPPPSTFAGQFVPGQVLLSPAPLKTPSWPWRNNVSYYPPIDAGAAFVCQDFATVVSVRTYDGTSSVHTDDGTVYVHTDDGTVNVHTDDGTVNVHTDDGTTNVHTLDGTADNCGR